MPSMITEGHGKSEMQLNARGDKKMTKSLGHEM